jgi:hypothetical protein
MCGSSLPPVVCRGFTSYLLYLCLFAYSGVQHILCFVFVLFFFVLCTLCCQFLWVVLCFCFVFLRLVYPVLPVSLCCVLFFFVLCTLCCQFLWIIHFSLPLRCSLTFIYKIFNKKSLKNPKG